MPPVNTIRVPQWNHPDVLSSIEDRIDSALSSANSVLNFALGPVRAFVGRVLHPVIAFTDLTVGWVYGVGHWAFDRLSDLAADAAAAVGVAVGNAADWASDAYWRAELFTRNAVGDLRHTVDDLVGDVARVSARALAGVEGLIRAGVKEATDFARQWGTTVYWEAVKVALRVETDLRALVAQAAAVARSAIDTGLAAAGRAVGEVRDFAVAGLNEARRLAHELLDEAVTIAHGLVDVLVRDVLNPLAGSFRHFVETEWRWAAGLLHVVEQVAEWLLWVDRWVVGDVIATYKALKDFDPFDPEQRLAVMEGAVRVAGI